MTASKRSDELAALRHRLSNTTIPAMFLERVQNDADEVAFCYKDRGIYQQVTWQNYKEHVENFCLGLLELGLTRGDRVAIMGDPCPEWLYADIASQSAGATDFGIYSTSSPQQTRYMVERTKARFLIAENQEYVDKILPAIAELPFLQKVIVADSRGMFLYEDARLNEPLDVLPRGSPVFLVETGESRSIPETTRASLPTVLCLKAQARFPRLSPFGAGLDITVSTNDLKVSANVRRMPR